MNEKSLKNKIRRLLLNEGAFVYCPNDNYQPGIPDILFCVGGKFRGVEIKLSRHITEEHVFLHHPLTAPQNRKLRDIAKAGGMGFVVTGLNSLDMIMITDIVNLPSGKISKLNKAGVIETAMGIPCLF